MKTNSIKRCELLNTITFLFLLGFLNSCVGLKPVGDVHYPTGDSNNRVQVSNARYKKKINGVGISTIALGTAGAGLVGYNSNLIGIYSEGERNTNQYLNMGVGAVAGFGVSYRINLASLGKQKYKPLQNWDDRNKWVRKKMGNGYVIIDDGLGLNKFRLIHEDSRTHFYFNRISDFQDYEKAFSLRSSYFDRNVRRSISGMDRSLAIKVYRGHYSDYLTEVTVESIEDHIYEKSNSIKSLGETARLIPRYKSAARERAFAKAYSISSYATFAAQFPEWRQKAKDAALASVRSISSVNQFKISFPGHEKELIQRAERTLSGSDLYKLADLFFVRCTDMRPNSEVEHPYYVPPDSKAIISLKKAPSRNIYIEYPGRASFSRVAERDELLQEEFTLFNNRFKFFYAVEMTVTFSDGEFLPIRINNNSSDALRYCIHYVVDDLEKDLINAGVSTGIGELIDYFGGKNAPLLKAGQSIVTALWNGENVLKRLLADAAADQLVDKLGLGAVGSFGTNLVVDYFMKVYKYIP